MSVVDLRHYQQQASDAVMADIPRGKSGVVVHATGTGKAVVIADVCKRYWQQYRKPVLVIAHRERLITQLARTIGEGVQVAVEMAEQKAHDIHAPVTVASVPSLARESRRKRYHAERFGLVITDEAHRAVASGHLSIMDHFPNAYRLGFTATPDRADGKGLPFDRVLHEYRLSTAIKDGYLCPIEAELIPIRIDMTKARIRMGDFQDSQIDEAVTPYLERIAQEIASRPHEKHLVFLPLVKTSKLMTEILAAKGMRPIHMDASTGISDEAIKRYESGGYNVICNAMMLTEGVDIPCVSCITNLRATTSRVTYSQIIGRGTRLHPDKDKLTVLDFMWHTRKHRLCKPASLFANSEREEEIMEAKFRAGGKLNLLQDHEEAKEQATSLVKRIKEHSHKDRELLDPLTLGEYKIADYEEKYSWQGLQPTGEQVKWLKSNGIDPDRTTRGQAKYLADKMALSLLATPAQKRMLMSHGAWRNGMTKTEASQVIDKVIGKYNRRKAQ